MTLTVLKSTGFVFHRISLNLKFSDFFFFIIRCGGFCFSRSVVSDSCKSMDCSPLGSSVHRISQARILEWVAISFLHGNSRTRGFPNQGFPEPDELASLESPALQADS